MSGYIGNIPVPQATQSREVFTATSGQTTFATVGYPVGFVDVWLNGVKLVAGTDFTATNGSDVVLTVGAATGDTVEVISNSTFEVNSQTFTGGLTVNNDAATVLTVNRATSEGTLVDFKKDGTSVGSVVTNSGRLAIGEGNTGVEFASVIDTILPHSITTNTNRDASINIGYPSQRFKDLYLSGGVYLGGTGAANLLDDYETGFWVPIIHPSVIYTGTLTLSGNYTKIGRMVWVNFRVVVSGGSFSVPTAGYLTDNLPFAVAVDNIGGYGAGQNNQTGATITPYAYGSRISMSGAASTTAGLYATVTYTAA